MSNKEILTDADLMGWLQISPSTLWRILNGACPGSIDLHKAKPFFVGKQRRWHRVNVEALIGVSNKERER